MSPTIEPKPHIAVLEDHEDTREMLRVGLESHFSIREFSNAPDLLTALEREKFSAILADIMMPGVDGYGLIRTLRADRRFARLCIIALTALAMTTDREKALAAGFTAYLVKPIAPMEIASELWRCLKPLSNAPPAA